MKSLKPFNPNYWFKNWHLLRQYNSLIKAIFGICFVACCFLMASLPVMAQVPSPSLEKNQWACELMLCLASEKPVMQEAFCSPSMVALTEHIKQWNELDKAEQVPACQEAKNGGSYLEIFQSQYAQCPAGMTALDVGISLLITNPEQAQIWKNTDVRYFVGRNAEDLPASFGKDWDQIINDGIGDGKTETVKAYVEKRSLKYLTCVAGYLGKTLMPVRKSDEKGHLSARVEKLEVLPLYQYIVRITPPEASFMYRISVQNQVFKSDFLP